MEDFVIDIAQTRWLDRGNVARELARDPRFAPVVEPGRAVRTVALYYHTLAGGGAQRVTVEVARLLAADRTVVLISDEGDESAAPDGIAHELLPVTAKNTGEGYAERLAAWRRIVSEHAVDCVISGEWIHEATFWDLLAVRCCPERPAFIVHSHNFNAVPFGFAGEGGFATAGLYALCDGVATLSETDRRYASCFNGNAACILNPTTLQPAAAVPEVTAPNLIWVGRFAREKQPSEAIRAMAHIVASRPDARLTLLGDGPLRDELEKLVEELGLGEAVEFCGFVDDPHRYLEQAAVGLCTSRYEGYALSIAEMLACGVPVVSYDMPWLTLFEDGRGIVPVPQDDPQALADAALPLLGHPADRAELGQAGLCHAAEIAAVDVAARWRAFLDGVFAEHPIDADPFEVLMFSQIAAFEARGKKELKDKIATIEAKRAEENKVSYDRLIAWRDTEAELENLRNSRSYKLGHTLTAPARKLRGGGESQDS